MRATINDRLKKSRTSKDVLRIMNDYLFFEKKNDVYALYLRRNLAKETKLDKSLILAYNYLMNQEIPMKTNDMKKTPWKGTAIRGMEVSNPYR